MNRYYCLCGKIFKTKKVAEHHVEIKSSLCGPDEPIMHVIYIKKWHERFTSWFFSRDINLIITFLAGAIINGIFLKYTLFTETEKFMVSACMGMVMYRLFTKDNK